MGSCESLLHVDLKNFLGPHSRLPEVLHLVAAELAIGQLGLSGTEVRRSLMGKVQLFATPRLGCEGEKTTELAHSPCAVPRH